MPIRDPEGPLVPLMVADTKVLQACKSRGLRGRRLLRASCDKSPLPTELHLERRPADAADSVLLVGIDRVRSSDDLRHEKVPTCLIRSEDRIRGRQRVDLTPPQNGRGRRGRLFRLLDGFGRWRRRELPGLPRLAGGLCTGRARIGDK